MYRAILEDIHWLVVLSRIRLKNLIDLRSCPNFTGSGALMCGVVMMQVLRDESSERN